MLLTLRLQNFRCFSSLQWELPAQGAILIGDNAQGKTSILEAICFALSLHSPRCKRMDKLARHEQHQFGIALDTDEQELRLRWQPRDLQLQKSGISCHDFDHYLCDAPPLAWLGNKDIALVQGAAEDRRNYLDFLGAQWHPSYRQALSTYRKALRARNALLKNPRRNLDALRSFSSVLAEPGEIIYQLRLSLIERLQRYVKQSHNNIAKHQSDISLHYKPNHKGKLFEALEQHLESDLRLGYTGIGPQRDDFSIKLNGATAADFASEGEQRTLSIALQLGQANMLTDETGRVPILLIDDIFGELDPARRCALLEQLPQETQVIITTTQVDWLKGSRAPLPLYHVKERGICPC